MIYWGDEAHLGRLERIAVGYDDVEPEDAVLITRPGRPLDVGFQAV